MKLVRRVPRTSPLHMDLQGFPCHSILVTCSQREETLGPGTQGRGRRGVARMRHVDISRAWQFPGKHVTGA